MKKQDGFPGQRSYVFPERILSIVKDNPLISDLYITDIGYYPQASYHFKERKTGVDQTILIYNVHGNGTIKTPNRLIQLPEDHFLIIPPNTPHAYYAETQSPWSIYWVHFAGKKAGEIAKPVLQAILVERSQTSRTKDRIELFEEIFINIDRGFSIEQQAAYPWNGKVVITLDPGSAKKFKLHLRVPGWASDKAMPGDHTDSSKVASISTFAPDWLTATLLILSF